MTINSGDKKECVLKKKDDRLRILRFVLIVNMCVMLTGLVVEMNEMLTTSFHIFVELNSILIAINFVLACYLWKHLR